MSDTNTDDIIPWSELSQTQQESFAELCGRFVGIETVNDAKQYYGNKEKLLEDATGVTNE